MDAANVVTGVTVLVGRGMPENRRDTFMACLWLKVAAFILPQPRRACCHAASILRARALSCPHPPVPAVLPSSTRPPLLNTSILLGEDAGDSRIASPAPSDHPLTDQSRESTGLLSHSVSRQQTHSSLLLIASLLDFVFGEKRLDFRQHSMICAGR